MAESPWQITGKLIGKIKPSLCFWSNFKDCTFDLLCIGDFGKSSNHSLMMTQKIHNCIFQEFWISSRCSLFSQVNVLAHYNDIRKQQKLETKPKNYFIETFRLNISLK